MRILKPSEEDLLFDIIPHDSSVISTVTINEMQLTTRRMLACISVWELTVKTSEMTTFHLHSCIGRDRADYVNVTTHAQVKPQRASADTFNPIMVTMETHTHT